MLWVLLPFAIWLWLGVAYVIANTLIAIVTLVVTEEFEMMKRARLIRYTTVADADHPHLLSVFDEQKNIQMIDRELASYLPVTMRNRLEMSVIPATMLSPDATFFLPYEVTPRSANTYQYN